MARQELLTNGRIGKPFHPYRDNKNLIIAAGWAPWWLNAAEGSPDWKNRTPIFSAYTLDDSLTQQLSTPWGTHEAGLWQQVPSVAGNQYELSVEGQAWSSEDASPGSQLEASNVNLQVGIDPTGGLDPTSPLIVWSEAAQPLSHWETVRAQAEAEASIITIFVKSAPNLPKRLQSIFWRNAFLRPIGRHKRGVNIVGLGDTHIALEPEQPKPGEPITAVISASREHKYTDLIVMRPDNTQGQVTARGRTLDDERFVWRYEFSTDMDGLYDIRFVGDFGARLLALRLLQVARNVQLVPSDSARMSYRRVYVLLPPTASQKWMLAAVRGGYDGRFTIGFSADDAGIGNLENRHVLAVNPHHWPEVLTASWFQQHYPGVKFTPVVANQPEDLEAWLKNWTGLD
ncbi:hypothetical protein [Candidatus Leptofilum sp.]|uniref:hypothetical protein n=1 Tax=Candidatus Leptofilum sp. TaxID=3241576 RepID=UPI003B5BA7E8